MTNCLCFLFSFSEANLSRDPGQAVVRVSQEASGGRLPGRGGVPASKAHLVARSKEAEAARGGEIKKEFVDYHNWVSNQAMNSDII
jgi:hypothetical protein